MSNLTVTVSFKDLNSRQRVQFDVLVHAMKAALDDPDGLGLIMTALAHSGQETIMDARAWLDNAESPNGMQWDSHDVIGATGTERFIGSPEIMATDEPQQSVPPLRFGGWTSEL